MSCEQWRTDAVHCTVTGPPSLDTHLLELEDDLELKGFFRSDQRDLDTYSWTHLTAGEDADETSELVDVLADRIMEVRCPGHHYAAWVDHRDNGIPLPAPVISALPFFIGKIFGTPGQEPLRDYLQGYVAEALWKFLSQEHGHRYPVVCIEWGWDPTDPGPDGLLVHRLDDDALGFRLWEVKKSTGASGIAPVIQAASSQVSERAGFYLARLSKAGPSPVAPEAQELTPELQELFDYLVEHWLNADPNAAAGVSIASSPQRIPDPCFHQLPQTLPDFETPSRLRGLWIVIPDFSSFCDSVRRVVWNGL